jgi:hypothetical protein
MSLRVVNLRLHVAAFLDRQTQRKQHLGWRSADQAVHVSSCTWFHGPFHNVLV